MTPGPPPGPPPAPPAARPTARAAGGQPGRRRGEDGSATVLVLALCGVLLLAGSLAGALGAVTVARHRAASAADLAALAGASAASRGADACAAAGRSAARADAQLVRCLRQGTDVAVEVSVRPPGAIGRLGPASARARAGPSGGAAGTP